MFKKGRDADNQQVSLPEARKALAERYTIDAEEAEARAQRAEGLPEREAWAQRATEERTRRLEAEAKAKLAAAEQARRHRAEAWARARREEAGAPTLRAAQEQQPHETPILALVPEPEPELETVPEPELEAVPEPEPELLPEPEPEPVEAVAPAGVEPAPSEQETQPPAEPVPARAEPAEDLPVYAWVQRAVPEESAAADWTRELVKAKETRNDDARSA